MTDRHRYNKAQLEAYYDRIGLPSASRQFTVAGFHPHAQLHFLSVLQKHQLMMIPFENLTLHYSLHRVINLNPDHLLKKIVYNSGRGGYCLENNSLFLTVLLSLGYNAYMTGARVFDRDSSKYGGFTHCLNIVKVGINEYAIDVCFGSRVPVLPLELFDGKIQPHSKPGQMRVRYSSISQGLSPNQRLWVYEHRHNDESRWIPQYCFSDLEFLPEDISVMNWSPAKSAASFFTQKVVCVRFTSESENYIARVSSRSFNDKPCLENTGAIDGALIIDGDWFKWRKQGIVQWEERFCSEEERIEALRTHFDITLEYEERAAIKGCVGEVSKNNDFYRREGLGNRKHLE